MGGRQGRTLGDIVGLFVHGLDLVTASEQRVYLAYNMLILLLVFNNFHLG